MSSPDTWSSAVKGAGEEDRKAAVEALQGRADHGSLAALDKALGDESWRVRKAAIESFKHFPDRERAIKTLVEALGDEENTGRRNSAVEALVAMGRDAAPELARNLDHPDHDIRKFAVDILGEIKDPGTLDHIVKAASDSQENVRLAAVEAMGQIGGEKAYHTLLSLLGREDVTLQFSVLHSLGRLERPLPIKSIKPLLTKRILRRAVYEALGQTGSREAVEILAKGLAESAKSPRQAAVRAIHKLSSRKSIRGAVEKSVREQLAGVSLESFSDLLDANLYTKTALINLLSMAGTPQAVRMLIRISGDDSVRVEVEEALAAIKERSPGVVERVLTREKAAEEDLAGALEQPPLPGRMTPGPMSDQQFQAMQDMIVKESGLYYDYDLKYLVERRVQRRMDEVQLPDYDAYLFTIGMDSSTGRKERETLLNALSTNETYFFREDFQLKAFKEEILPEIIENKKRSKSGNIKIWSAGCSSGEEPYTIAILVKETPAADGFNVSIRGSDISAPMIEKAKSGLYTRSSFRATEDRYVKKYFQETDQGFKISDEIRSMVEFDITNLVSIENKKALQGLDVIFCRNVIIYFHTEAKRRLVQEFFHMLNPGGYLLLGHSESLMSLSTDFELVHLKRDLVYRKPPEEPGP